MPLRRHQRVSIRAIALTHHKPLPDTHPDTALHAAILDGPPDPDAGRLGTGDPPRMMQGLTRLQALIPNASGFKAKRMRAASDVGCAV